MFYSLLNIHKESYYISWVVKHLNSFTLMRAISIRDDKASLTALLIHRVFNVMLVNTNEEPRETRWAWRHITALICLDEVLRVRKKRTAVTQRSREPDWLTDSLQTEISITLIDWFIYLFVVFLSICRCAVSQTCWKRRRRRRSTFILRALGLFLQSECSFRLKY